VRPSFRYCRIVLPGEQIPAQTREKHSEENRDCHIASGENQIDFKITEDSIRDIGALNNEDKIREIVGLPVFSEHGLTNENPLPTRRIPSEMKLAESKYGLAILFTATAEPDHLVQCGEVRFYFSDRLLVGMAYPNLANPHTSRVRIPAKPLKFAK